MISCSWVSSLIGRLTATHCTTISWIGMVHEASFYETTYAHKRVHTWGHHKICHTCGLGGSKAHSSSSVWSKFSMRTEHYHFEFTTCVGHPWSIVVVVWPCWLQIQHVASFWKNYLGHRQDPPPLGFTCHHAPDAWPASEHIIYLLQLVYCIFTSEHPAARNCCCPYRKKNE